LIFEVARLWIPTMSLDFATRTPEHGPHLASSGQQ
jgi:hypothetical protein